MSRFKVKWELGVKYYKCDGCDVWAVAESCVTINKKTCCPVCVDAEVEKIPMDMPLPKPEIVDITKEETSMLLYLLETVYNLGVIDNEAGLLWDSDEVCALWMKLSMAEDSYDSRVKMIKEANDGKKKESPSNVIEGA